MAKKVQLMTNAKEWQTVNGVEVLVDVPQEDINPITDSSCIEIEGHRTLEETINQDNMFTPEIVETKVHSKVGGVYHDNVVDGAYEEAILYGNTQVNLVESVTTGTKYIPHSFTSFQGNESKIGNYHSGRTNQVAPLVKGVTMVNLCQSTSVTLSCQHTTAVANHNAKPNTKYTLKCKFTEKNKNAGIMIQSYGYKDGTWGYIEISKTIQNLGDDVLLTFTTHEQADSIIIYNNPAFCEDANDSITLEDIMVIEGDVTDLDLPFFKGMRSVELARPLTNLLDENTRYTLANASKATYTYDNGTATITATALGMYTAVKLFLDEKLKSNTTYLVMWDSRTYTSTSSYMEQQGMLAFDNNKHQSLGNSYPNENPLCPTLRSLMFNTGDTPLDKISIEIRATLSNSETGTTTVKGLRVFEWDDSLRTLDLQTIGYFSGTKYVSVRALETEGKNLYPHGDINFTPTQVQWHDAKGTNYMYGDIAQKSKCRFLLKKGTYKLSSDYNNRTNLGYMALVTDKEETMKDTTFTLEEDTYLTLRLQPVEANVATTLTNIQIERGETVTTYEAYQGRYYKPRETEEIILRSLPNGVCDTFNLQTGELVQNIGVAIYDGSDDELWGSDGVDSNNIPYFTITKSLPAIYTTHKLMYNCDIYKPCLDIDTDKIAITTTHYGLMLTANSYIRIKNGATTREEFMASLKEKPVTLIYALKEPIITKLQTYDRIYNSQGQISMGNNLSALTYNSNNSYLKVGNLSPVPAILEPITSIPYNVRLKPSTSYTIKYNRGGHSNSMKFDLGGSVVEKTNATDLGIVPEEFTVRTPAILSHEQLILSGTGYAHNFIIVEGDITGTELPYFQGMKDVKMPIVKNISRNLLNESSMRVFYESNIVLRTYDVFPCKPNTRYCFVSVGGETSCNWHVCKKDAHYERPENESVGIIQYLGYSREIVTPQDCYYMCIHTGSNPTTDKEVYDIKTAIYEGSFAECVNYGYEDYKENSVYAVQGEYPITSEMIEQGGFSMSGSSDGSYENSKYTYTARLRSKDLIPVKPNTTYAFAHSFSKFAYNVYQWDGNKKFIDETSQYFASGQVETITTTADTQYIHFLMSKHDASQDITVGEYDWSQFHMYELDSTINLRSLPNGVKDELNLLTGEYIQRVGEVVLDGNEGWRVGQAEIGQMAYFMTDDYYPQDIKLNTTTLKLTTQAYGYPNIPFTDVWHERQEGLSSSNGKPGIRAVSHTYSTIEEWKASLQSNPITVQYELAEPIISHVRLVSSNQEREVGVKLPNGVCNTYNPSTGITTVRVGKVVLDGSENWDVYDQAPSNLDYFRLPIPTMFSTGNMNADKETECKYVVSDTFPTVGYYQIQKANSTINYSVISGMYSSSLGVQCLYVYYKPSADLATFKTYLSQNPITAWYELKYPQIQPDIVLPNGVHDEYNPETGVYTKRVGFVELDGSENWKEDVTEGAKQPNTHIYYTPTYPNMKPLTTDLREGAIICDSYTVIGNIYYLDEVGLMINTDPRIYIRDKVATVNEFKVHLSSNPIKVWYELATPITYQLTPYFGLPQPYAYEDGYLIHDSAYPETTLPPEFKYKLVANRTGQVMQNNRKLQEHTTRLSNLEALIIEATIESLFNRELQTFELELMDIQLIEL